MAFQEKINSTLTAIPQIEIGKAAQQVNDPDKYQQMKEKTDAAAQNLKKSVLLKVSEDALKPLNRNAVENLNKYSHLSKATDENLNKFSHLSKATDEATKALRKSYDQKKMDVGNNAAAEQSTAKMQQKKTWRTRMLNLEDIKVKGGNK